LAKEEEEEKKLVFSSLKPANTTRRVTSNRVKRKLDEPQQMDGRPARSRALEKKGRRQKEKGGEKSEREKRRLIFCGAVSLQQSVQRAVKHRRSLDAAFSRGNEAVVEQGRESVWHISCGLNIFICIGAIL